MGCLESGPPGADGWPSSGRRRRGAARRGAGRWGWGAAPLGLGAQGREGEQEEDRAPGEAAFAVPLRRRPSRPRRRFRPLFPAPLQGARAASESARDGESTDGFLLVGCYCWFL